MITFDQSEASVQVMYSLLTNQRPVSGTCININFSPFRGQYSPGRDVRHVHEHVHGDGQVVGGRRGLAVRPDVGQRVVRPVIAEAGEAGEAGASVSEVAKVAGRRGASLGP